MNGVSVESVISWQFQLIKINLVPMRYCPFRQFVIAGKNRYDISHAVVQKVVPRKIREG